MTLHVKHKFESLKSDGSDPTVVRPSNWNDEHDISTAPGKLIGSDLSGPAAAQELPGAFDEDGNFTLTAALGFFMGAKGTTGQRPATPLAGYERWNITTTKKEMYDGTSWGSVATEEYVTDAIDAIALSVGVKGFIGGMTYQVGGVNEIDIAEGTCTSDDGTTFIAIEATSKRVDQAWAEDSASVTGSLDTGVVANSPYYLFAIKNPTTGATATLTSLSRTAPTMPTDFTKKRLIGWLRRSGGDIVAFHTYELEGGGLELAWDDPLLDISAISVDTSRTIQALAPQVPDGISVKVKLSLQQDFTSSTLFAINVSCPDQDNGAVAFGSALLGTIGFTQSISLTGGDQSINGNTGSLVWPQTVRTDTTGQIAVRASGASATLSGSVLGFEWSRR